MKNPALRKKLGQAAAKKAAEDLDLYKGTGRLEEIYTKILQN